MRREPASCWLPFEERKRRATSGAEAPQGLGELVEEGTAAGTAGVGDDEERQESNRRNEKHFARS